MARLVASRATCSSNRSGCVVIKDNCVLLTGHTGAIRGARHCDEVGCKRDGNGVCFRAIHAEINAVAQAARRGVSLQGATVYCTHKPCRTCFQLLVASGVHNIYYDADAGPEYTQVIDVKMLKLEE